MMTKRMLVGLLAAAALLAGTAREARAVSTRGTMITNISSATFNTADGLPFMVTYSATALVRVAAPHIRVRKSATPSQQVPGGCVTFVLWLKNLDSMMTAYNVTMFDQLPDNMLYNDAYSSWNGGSGGTWFVNASATGVAPYPSGEPPVGQVAPYYMQWMLTQLGPRKSAYVQFSVCIL